MIKVALLGIFYPMAILRYFERALRRRDDLEICAIGPYTGQMIPWANGIALPAKYAKCPDIIVSTPIPGIVPAKWVEKFLPWTPDLWLQIDAGFHASGRPRAGINAIVATDPHVLNYDHQRGYADFFFNMQRFYKEPDDIYLPYARDPQLHTPFARRTNKWDAILLGLHYTQRNQLVQALGDAGLKVLYRLGPVFDEARTLYGISRIALNWSTLKDLNARVFETMGMGMPLVTNRVPDLGSFFADGVEFLGFDSREEAVEQVIRLKNDPVFAGTLGRRARKAAHPHTWDARINQILREVGLA